MYSNLCITVLVGIKNVLYVVEGWGEGGGGGGADEAANSDREQERQISASFRQLLLILNYCKGEPTRDDWSFRSTTAEHNLASTGEEIEVSHFPSGKILQTPCFIN